ncbi:hypothetical protein LTR95_002999 [Oleoguttula sp. CCFEE 5521]
MPSASYEQSAYPFNAGPLGHIEGLTISQHDKSRLHYFGGLPYALPPVGKYRFRRPRPLPPCYQHGTRASPGRFTGSAAVCPQPWDEDDKSLWDENCLQLNLYIPAGTPPKGGWPCLVYLHGGYLQWGDPNMEPGSLVPLLTETAFKAIIVAPAYRVNAFGFLASHELDDEARKDNVQATGNCGFWDQRLAIEWAWKNISLFGGDQTNVTLAGYSAGAHSTFQQLAHELYFVPDEKAIIKRAIMWSNSPGVQPRSLDQHQTQFDELCAVLGIANKLSATEKLTKLRAVPATELVAAQHHLTRSEFRAYSDDSFISSTIISHINSGDFAKRMKRRKIKLMNGECRDEHNSYRSWRTPSDSYDAVKTRLTADYPCVVVEKLMKHYCKGTHDLPKGYKDWPDLFGHIYADCQVHNLERGFHNALFKGGVVAGEDVLRYRFDKRMKCVDAIIPPDWGVTHATDLDSIWFWGACGDGLTAGEKDMLKDWNEQFAAFVKGDDVQWGPSDPKQMRRLRADGKTDVWEDDRWEQGLEVWDLLNGDEGKSRL